jgi:hypothetical protein
MTGEVNQFASDTHRRVCANLSQPRTAEHLADFLSKTDPQVSHGQKGHEGRPNAHEASGVRHYLNDLERDGLVVKLGEHAAREVSDDDEDPDAEIKALEEAGRGLIDAVSKSKTAVTLPKEKAATFVERACNPDKEPYFVKGRAFYALTEKGLAKLTGPVPDEPPPLEGRALREAKRFNKEWYAEQRRVARERRKEEVKRAEKRLADLKRLVKEAEDEN